MTDQREPEPWESPTIDTINRQIKRITPQKTRAADVESMLAHLRELKRNWLDGDTLARIRVAQDLLSVLYIRTDGAVERIANEDAMLGERITPAESVREIARSRAKINDEIAHLAEQLAEHFKAQARPD